MPKVLRTDIAEEDLLDIWLFIAEDNIRAADNWLDTLVDKCHKLAVHPFSGKERKELGSQIRSFPVHDYVLFYQPIEDGILLIRALHGSRDIDISLFQ